jgi:membrane-associated phospholipid phosphatase
MDGNTPLHRSSAPHREVLQRYRRHLARSEFRWIFFLSLVYFVASIIFAFFAINYANDVASNSVTDLILSNIPIFDVDGLFAYGTLLLIAFITLLVLVHPKRIPFVLNALGTFWIIRSIFTSLTHLGPLPTAPPNGDWGTLLSHFLFGSDYFFSGHVGVCFLMALVFWNDKVLRYLFLAWSAYMSIVVLLGHYHYSIDVASAYFITYTIYVLCVKFFPRSLAIFNADPVPLP